MRLFILVAALLTVGVIVSAGSAIRPNATSGIDRTAVASVKSSNERVVVRGEQRAALSNGGYDTRIEWQQKLAAVAEAQQTGAKEIVTKVFENGKLVSDQLDWVNTDNLDFTPVTRDEIVANATLVGHQVDVELVAVNYVPLFGGTAEIVIQPDNEAKFLATSGQSFYRLLGPLAEGSRPYLLTVVDGTGAPRLIMGFVTGVGGGDGQGMGWRADGVRGPMLTSGSAEILPAIPPNARVVPRPTK